MSTVAVVIVTYDSRDEIGPCIASILANDPPPDEVVVVDNSSSDETVALIRAAGDKVSVIERRTNGGLSRAVNEGVAATSSHHVLVLNPDTVVAPIVVDRLSKLLREHADIGVAAPRLVDSDGSVQLSCREFPGHRTALFNRYSLLTRLLPGNRFSRRYLMTDFRHDARRDIDWVSGAALMFPRAIFDELGGWDPGYFMFSEDVDFCRRVRNAGYRVVYEPSATVVHAIGASRRSAPARMIIERHKSMWRYYRKHLRGNAAVDAATAAGIVGRCLALLVADRVRAVLGRARPS